MTNADASNTCLRRRDFIRIVSAGAAFAGIGSAATTRPADAATASISVFELVEVELVRAAVDGFEQALKAKSPSLSVHTYNAQGQGNLVPTIARQVVRSQPDLIAVIGTPAVLACAHATSTIPIVFIAMGDPVGAGVADSLAKPGRNLTGTTDWIPPEKTLETVVDICPSAKSLGTIWDPSNQNGKVFHDALAAAARARGLAFVDVGIASAGELFPAARSIAERADVIVLGPDATIVQGLPAVASAALKGSKPLFLTAGDAKTPGVFMSLGVDYRTLGARTGVIAAALLAGASPATTPIVGMDKFDLILNRDTAKSLALDLPPSLAGRVKVAG